MGDSGPLVEGRAAELVSVLGSRPRMLPALRGDGVDLLASRVSPRRTRKAEQLGDLTATVHDKGMTQVNVLKWVR